ncbi:MAG: hypothetical protein HN726_00915 [Candidatus Magasanikbacteria bacterium]|nr:hypothetical protein [Candidatus Magasanikbacteria bacterium]MBT7754740.1 hypothetical protein [Candidatus Magasanikbacteria bacterium]
MKKFIDQQALYITKIMYKYLGEDNTEYDFYKASHYSIGPEGHRYRSIVSLEIYKLLGGDPEKYEKTIAGLEYIHHSSLILDDLPCMDDSQMRKSKQTTHLAFGESTAVLSALHLYERGRMMLCENAKEHLADKDFIKFQQFLSKNLIKLFAGQELDLKKNTKKIQLEQMMENKNRIFHLACTIPSFLLDKKYFQKFSYIGQQLSIGYQYFDDLRDLQPSFITGKPPKQDLGKYTSLYQYGEKNLYKKLETTKKNVLETLLSIHMKNDIIPLINHILTQPS